MAEEVTLPQFISIKQAVATAKEMGITVVQATAIKWIKENELGYQAFGEGSRWNVNEKLWKEFLSHGPKSHSK